MLWNNQTISDTLDELSIKFPELFALLDKEVNVSTCLTNIQWGCESGHPTLNDKIFWPAGQEAYKRVFSLSIMLQEGSQTWITAYLSVHQVPSATLANLLLQIK